MGMSIDDSERYLRLMLGGMKYAVNHWKDRDKEEADIEQTNVEAVKTALDTMRKYQKIEQTIQEWRDSGFGRGQLYEVINGVLKDENIN